MNWEKARSFAAIHQDYGIRSDSQSGGIFSALSDAVLAEHGVIYGCILTEDFAAAHARAETAEGRNRMRGSKYIQSNPKDTFQAVRRDLEHGKKVLFSGTSCQVAGLRAYLGKGYEQLLCVDVVCHGVPSPMVWKKYLSWQEKRNRGRVVSVCFRNKKEFGWHSHVETLKIEKQNGKTVTVNSEIFKHMFYGHYMLRPCCYVCPYKGTVHPGDITIADYWGIEKAAPGFSDGKGISLVLINNDIGEKYFNQIKDHLIWTETRIEDSLQPPLIAPFEAPSDRERFWNTFYTKSFRTVANRFAGQGILRAIKRKLRSIIK